MNTAQLLRHVGLLTSICVASACVVEGAPPPLKPGDGVTLGAGNSVAIDGTKVPLLPTCEAGELVRKTAAGWECAKPVEAATIVAGAGLTYDGGVLSAHFGAGATDVATGAHNHDERYWKRTDPLPWSSVDPATVPPFLRKGEVTQYTDDDAQQAVTWNTLKPAISPTDLWPGSIPYAQVIGAPVVTWGTIAGTVSSSAAWPGNVSYSHLTDVPATTWNTVSGSVLASTAWPGTMPYGQLTNAPLINWTTVRPSVTPTTAWPGTVAYSQVTGVPSTTWSTIASSVLPGTAWPGTVAYSQIQGAPSIDWTTVAPSVSASTAWPGSVPYAQITNAPVISWGTVAPTVATSAVWPGSVPYSQVTGVPSIGWTTISSTVTSATDWPGTVAYSRVTNAPIISWDTIAPSVPATTNWPGTLPYARVSGAPDFAGLSTTVSGHTTQIAALGTQQTSLGTQQTTTAGQVTTLQTQVTTLSGQVTTATNTTAQLAYLLPANSVTFSGLPSAPADGQLAYVTSNQCTYQYTAAASRWEITNCNFYPDWLRTNTNEITFVDSNGTSHFVTFPLTDGVATRDFIYGADYNSSTAGTGWMLETGNLSGDDGAAPVRLRNRWQRCGYSISGRSVCLPYVGFIRDTNSNQFETEWFRSSNRTWLNSASVTLSPGTATVSMAQYSSPATVGYFIQPYLPVSQNGQRYFIAPTGMNIGNCSNGYVNPGNATGTQFSSSSQCYIPQTPTKNRGLTVFYNNAPSSETMILGLIWVEESR